MKSKFTIFILLVHIVSLKVKKLILWKKKKKKFVLVIFDQNLTARPLQPLVRDGEDES